MNVLSLIDQYSAYNVWANTRIVDRVLREDPALLDVPVKSSFPSLRSTFMHIRNAEAAWRARLAGEPQRWPADDTEEIGTFLKHVMAMRDHVRTMDEPTLLGMCTYKDLKGNEWTQIRSEMLMHCFNHGSYHRGQIVTMLRQLDLSDIPQLDLIAYQRL
jgi:uncharacterized damage-inducible protein DinB